MMKIGFLNTNSYDNVSDTAIYAATSQLLKGHQVYAPLTETKYSFNTGIYYSHDLTGCDHFISVGGDIFDNTRARLINSNFLQNLNQLVINPEKTFLFGQSIPDSCTGISLTMLCNRLRQLSSVTVRDMHSYSLLKKHKVDCQLSNDTAFVLNCSEKVTDYANTVLSSLSTKKTAIISVHDFQETSPAENNRYIKNMAKLSHGLLKHDYQPIFLIQSDVAKVDSDKAIAHAIQEQCPDIKIVDLFKLSLEFTRWELLQAMVKVADIIVAVCYHTAVLALAADRVPYNLFYSYKGQDLCQRLGVPGCHINLFNPEQSLAKIIATGREFFDSTPIKIGVQHDFMRALNRCYMNHHSDKGHNDFKH